MEVHTTAMESVILIDHFQELIPMETFTREAVCLSEIIPPVLRTDK